MEEVERRQKKVNSKKREFILKCILNVMKNIILINFKQPPAKHLSHTRVNCRRAAKYLQQKSFKKSQHTTGGAKMSVPEPKHWNSTCRQRNLRNI